MSEMAEKMDQAAKSRGAGDEKYLAFMLAGNGYDIGILKIKKIIEMLPITPGAQAPVFVNGVIDVRGQLIPVVDLRLRCGMLASEYTERTCIIVAEVEALVGTVMMGLVVDSVSNC